LASLPRADQQGIVPQLEPVSLDFKQVLYQPSDIVRHVYFPATGIVSRLVVLRGGSIEVSTIGNEGMVGLPVFLGEDRTAARFLVQVPGEAYRLSAGGLREEARRSAALHKLLSRYTAAALTQTAQAAACNGAHSVKQRCCRWLLTTHDRVQARDFPLTQEFFAEMLGVRRATVAEVARALQRAGLIRYRRGQIAILNREGLEKAACECYGVIKSAVESVFAGA
jgi:CRP-like cAMP-binding protein